MTFVTTKGGPHLHLLPTGPNSVEEKAREIAEHNLGLVVRLLSGKNMRTKEGIFMEFAAVLDFPSYFGRNWDAFDECLSDLEWLPSSGYILFISDASEILADELKDVPILLGVLEGAGRSWGAREGVGRSMWYWAAARSNAA